NLTRVFAEYISRVIQSTDSQMLMLRELYQNNEDDFAHWIRNAIFSNDLAAQFAVADKTGLIRYSSGGIGGKLIDISDREHFTHHVNAVIDELFISSPIIGRISGKATLNLTRRLSSADGTFEGVIVASLDIEKLEQFYNSIDLDKDGVVSL